MKTIWNRRNIYFYIGIGLSLLAIGGCAFLSETRPGMRSIYVDTEPQGARVTLTSMGTRQMQTFFTPVTIEYDVTPAIPPYITISKQGYKNKHVKLDGRKNSVKVILEKESPLALPGAFGFGGGSEGLPGGTDVGPQQFTPGAKQEKK